MQQSLNRILFSLLPLFPLVVACEGIDDPTSDKTSTTQQAVCAPATRVSTKAELVAAMRAALSKIPWQTEERFAAQTARISDDLQVVGTITLDSSDLAVQPADCAQSTCRPLRFRLIEQLAGARCDRVDTFAHWSFCERLTLENVTLRVRPVQIDGHPSQFSLMPTVELRGACGEPCAVSLQCAANGICFSSSMEHCQSCLGKPAQECACAGAPDGQACQLWISGDQERAGTCQAGLCKVQ